MAKKKFVGTATGSRLIQDDEEVKAKSKDVNLPDEKKGKRVGWSDWRGFKTGKKPGIIKDPIFGGEPDDPRWKEHFERVGKYAPESLESESEKRERRPVSDYRKDPPAAYISKKDKEKLIREGEKRRRR